MPAIEQIEKTVLALQMNQRVALEESLLDSISPIREVWLDAEESAEVERREREIQTGQVPNGS